MFLSGPFGWLENVMKIEFQILKYLVFSARIVHKYLAET